MKKILLFICFLTLSETNAQNLSFEKALELATNSKQKQVDLEVLANEINLKINKNKRLPIIYGESNLQRNLIVPSTPVPAIAFNPNATANEIMPLKFATDWSAKAGIQFALDVFNSNNKLDSKIAKNEYDLSILKQQNTDEDFKNLITDLYAQAVLAQLQFDAAIYIEKQFQETMQIINERNKVGRASELELKTASQKALELAIFSNEAEYIFKNKLIQLSKYITNSEFDNLSTTFEELALFTNSTSSDIEKLKLEIDSKEIQLKHNKWYSLPKITLNAFYGSQFFDNQLQLFENTNWFGNSYVNISLKFPLTEHIERNLKNKKLNYELDINKNLLKEAITNENIKNKQKQNDLKKLESNITLYKEIILLAEEKIEIVKSQLDTGKILISEYNKELENLIEQKKKLWQENYNYILKINE